MIRLDEGYTAFVVDRLTADLLSDELPNIGCLQVRVNGHLIVMIPTDRGLASIENLIQADAWLVAEQGLIDGSRV